MTDEYRRSAAIYDLLYTGAGIKDYRREASELDRVIQERCPGAKTLLDVACGTGQHLAQLRERYEIAGVDLSDAMLAEARRLLPNAQLQQGDMRTFDLGRTFDVAICLFSSIGYMTTAEDLNQALTNMARHVAPKGVLVIDGWVRPDEWREGGLRSPDVAANDDTSVVRMSQSTRLGDITTLEMHHLVQTRQGIQYFVETHALALVSTKDYLAALRSAGMEGTVIPDYMPGRDRFVAVR